MDEISQGDFETARIIEDWIVGKWPAEAYTFKAIGEFCLRYFGEVPWERLPQGLMAKRQMAMMALCNFRTLCELDKLCP